MKTLRGRQYSLKQQPQFTRLRKLVDPLPANVKDFLRRTTVFLHSLERGYWVQSLNSPPMKTLRGRQYSFEQQTQIKLKNKVLGLLASNMNDSLTEATLRVLSVVLRHFQQR
jgi:hypothetical protein